MTAKEHGQYSHSTEFSSPITCFPLSFQLYNFQMPENLAINTEKAEGEKKLEFGEGV